MRTAILLVVTMVTISSIPLMAHQAAATAQQSATASTNGTHVNEASNATATTSVRHTQMNGAGQGSAALSGPASGRGSANASAAAVNQMRPVKGELMGKLDSKSARVGQSVVVRTTEKLQTANGMVIPKGSRLMGHITEVQAHGSGHANSSMGIVFDRAELKNGQSFAIHSVIESVAPSASAMAASSMEGDDSFGTPMAPMMGGGAIGGGAIGGGTMGGGRAGGGLVGGTVGGAASATGNVASNLGTTTGGAMRTTGSLASNATAGVGNDVRGAAGATGSLDTHASAIPGVMLEGDATGSASGMLSATKRNVHLDSGTQMVLGIAAASRP